MCIRDRDSEALCQGLLPAPDVELHPAVATQLALYAAFVQVRRGDCEASTQSFLAARPLALASGQAYAAVLAVNGAAVTRNLVQDAAAALEHGQALLGLARDGWPGFLSRALATNAYVLRELGRLPEARELLEECLLRERTRPDSRACLIALSTLGGIELDRDEPEPALARFEQVLRSPGLWVMQRTDTLYDRTKALIQLGRYAEAEASARECLAMSAPEVVATSPPRVRALLADIWVAQGKTAEAQQAYADILAEPAFVPPLGVLSGAARAYAATGRHAEAYELSQRARAVEERTHSHQVAQRSQVLSMQFRTERSQLEAEYQRHLAEAAAERLSVLERNHSVLEQLGAIGRELTAQLDAERALAVLAERVRTLLPVDVLMVYLLDESGQKLECALCEEQGRAVPAPVLALDAPQSLVARCAREHQVLVLQDEATQGMGIPLEGRAPKRSLMFAPLLSGKTLVGVMSLQSEQAEAFGPEPQLIFATLCAYAAIAVDNARAYQRLSQMQRQLRAHERLAALGSMVAGLSHELNTPLGNALLAVSTMKEHGDGFGQRLRDGALRRSDWQAHAEALQQGIALAHANLETALGLVNQFRQIAQRRDTQQRRRFGLAEFCSQSLALRSSQASQSGHVIEIDVPPGLELDSYVHAIDQALDILVGNALVHGLHGDGLGGGPGRVLVKAEQLDAGLCRLEVIDDGRGIAPEVLARAFEPFFTTTFGKGGNGLGLSICHTLVEDVLGGTIKAFSEEGQGSRFVMELPLIAP